MLQKRSTHYFCICLYSLSLYLSFLSLVRSHTSRVALAHNFREEMRNFIYIMLKHITYLCAVTITAHSFVHNDKINSFTDIASVHNRNKVNSKNSIRITNNQQASASFSFNFILIINMPVLKPAFHMNCACHFFYTNTNSSSHNSA